MFPDAPTERGVKHINELAECANDGFDAYAVFVIQTDEADYFTPNIETHKEFAAALKNALKNGVKVLCLTCNVTADEIFVKDEIDYKI